MEDTQEVTEILVITRTAQQPWKASPNCPLHQQQVSVSDGGALTSPVDIIKGEIKFAWLALGGGWVGEGETCPLNHCLSWSKALPPPLPQRTCGAGGKTECHAFGVGPKPCPRGPVEQEARPSATPSSLQVLGMVSCTALAGCRAGP